MLADVAGVRITIVEDVQAGIDIMRTSLLGTIIRNHPKSIWQSKLKDHT
jgi:hypothetical protein